MDVANTVANLRINCLEGVIGLTLSSPLFPGSGNHAARGQVNYSWLDSEADDDFGSRRFNNPSGDVFNVGFIQDAPTWAAAFGATYRKQGEALAGSSARR
ncbi:hypothetical protein [Phenylobacterium sp.]|uniref:hypothetical protein n=1 Tax=Phenylobacterium sp. TaxID=1871053 RepID=UPI0027177353|nr:hypothetical protein [Phenylobacterium sp.]MDO8801971.1 hypothetical protein [Phenylobacterium sp.]